MKIDVRLEPADLRDSGSSAAQLELDGYDGLWTPELAHDPFLPLALAAVSTTTVDVGTAIAVALARNPMTLAVVADDLQRMSQGRFILGLGSQIRPHIERRYSMPWSQPVERMRELVLAVRAVWSAWSDGSALDVRGAFYTHTLMTPVFDPGPNPFGPPKIYLAVVGERMAEVAGEVADGVFVHSFTTERYLRERLLPAVHRGLAKAGRSASELEICLPGFVATGLDEQQLSAAVEATRGQIAFYASTPTYRPVLELHGWGDLQTELHALAGSGRADRWEVMGTRIDDDVLEAVALVGEPEQVGRSLPARFEGLIDRFSFTKGPAGPDLPWPALIATTAAVGARAHSTDGQEL
jgi:probable F420-dependent oxidoreductase